MNHYIYMDHAATTATNPEVVKAMIPFYSKRFGNPSSLYGISQDNKEEIQKAREVIGRALNTGADNIYFTSGGTEADNWALKGVAEAYSSKGKHIITTKIEHHAVLHTAAALEMQGFDVTYLDVDEKGLINLDTLKNSIREDTILISVMFANNEIGTLEPIAEIGEIAWEKNIIFHTDAVQAFAQVPIDVEAMKIDLLSASGHKFNGPKGVGFLYVRENVKLKNLIHGGGQEYGKRAGTENVPGIIGIAKATEISIKKLDYKMKYEIYLRNYVIERILSEIPYCRLNGHRDKRLPNNVNVSFQFVDSEAMLVMLDMVGVCASGGSACSSGNKKSSHVLLATGLPEQIARGTLRLTIGEENTKQEIDYVLNQLKQIIWKLRETSPSYEDFVIENKKSAY